MPSNPNDDLRNLARRYAHQWVSDGLAQSKLMELFIAAIKEDRAARPSLSTDGVRLPFPREDYAEVARLMREHGNDRQYAAIVSNNYNVLLSALDALSRTPSEEALIERLRDEIGQLQIECGIEGEGGPSAPVEAAWAAIETTLAALSSPRPSAAPQAQSEPMAWTDLARQIEALLALDRRDALTPPLPGLPRELLQRALDAFYGLAASPQPQPVAIKLREAKRGRVVKLRAVYEQWAREECEAADLHDAVAAFFDPTPSEER